MITVQVKLFAHLRDRSPTGAAAHSRELPDGATLSTLLEDLHITQAEAAIVVLNGRNTLQLATPLSPGDAVSIFPPVAGGSGWSAELVECAPQPDCLSLDPGTRIKTHLVRCRDASGALLWERSIYSQYDTRELKSVPEAILLGYDDRIVTLDPASGAERESFRIFLFDYFQDVGGERTLAKEKGSVLLLDRAGKLLWEHGSQEILAGMHLHERHVFLHFWNGSEVAGLRVPFLCLAVDTGQPDLQGPSTPPDFSELSRPEDIVGPRQKEGRAALAAGAKRLAEEHPSPWTRAMWDHVRGMV